MRRLLALLLVIAALGVFAAFCLVVLDEREQAFRTRLGAPETLLGAVLDEPGVYVRIPFLHEVHRYERRLLRYDAEPRELQLAGSLPVEVDYYLVWRIRDPRVLRERVGASRQQVLKLLDDTAFNEVRNVLAQHPLSALLSEQRGALTEEITTSVGEKLRPQGIEIVDLQIRDARYPEANLGRIFERMRSERGRVAKRIRAEGEEQGRNIRSEAEREAQVLRAEARRDAERLRGEGDADAARIYANAYDQDREFYAFMRSLEAYRRALDDETTVILSPQLPFLRYLFEEGGNGAPSGAGPSAPPEGAEDVAPGATP